MILTNRLFEREAPSREAKSIYIFSEGRKREYQYFKYFEGIDSRINVEVNRLENGDDNSPRGLLALAQNSFNSENPKYTLQEGDEVWIVFDSDIDKLDSRSEQITEVKAFCKEKNNWFVAESNPCFEVWLYYHKHSQAEEFESDEKCESWKKKVNDSYKGGFDSRRHPVYIEEATENSLKNYKENSGGRPEKGSSQVHLLAESILSVTADKIRKVKNSTTSNESSGHNT